MSDPIVMVQAFAELRYGVVAHMRENSVKYGLNFNQTPYSTYVDKHNISTIAPPDATSLERAEIDIEGNVINEPEV